MGNFLDVNCEFGRMTREVVSTCHDFSCSKDVDIHKFFHVEFEDYSYQLLGKTYCFTTKHDNKMVAAFTVANSSICVDNIPKPKKNKLNRWIPFSKQRSQYPAVLVGQLAVFDDFRGLAIGREMMDFIKAWFIDPLNKTGCRYIVVDAVNKEKVLQFYLDNGFDFIFTSAEEESHYLSKEENVKNGEQFRRTRLMYFDLMKLAS